MSALLINHDLCLACSSSLPTTVSKTLSEKTFTTPCCLKSICAQCLAANPRLARYNPCLACLGGVGVIAAGKSVVSNIDGAVRDEDNFAIGDDEDDDEEEAPPPAYPYPALQQDDSVSLDKGSAPPGDTSVLDQDSPQESHSSPTNGPARYYIKSADTLQGIALRFGVNGRELCSLNNLPTSTLSMTPHILHTRDSILLPLTAKAKVSDLNEPTPDEQRRSEARRAEKRLQVVAKEADWRVARAYVSLAADPEGSKTTSKQPAGLGGVEGRALDQYLDDSEWESHAGQPRIQGFPYFVNSGKGKSKSTAGGSAWIRSFKMW